MQEQYRYDAFISYRHSELDKFVAENLHKMMENFKLPGKTAAKANGRTAINRVFRDRDELPLASNLADPITEALSSSEFLIVICSPRLPQSRWCAKEIETFISMHGRDKVFAVLIEGEPDESFPPQLLYEEREVVGEDGTVTTEKVPVEPLAADVRGANNKEVYKALKSELLRLLAPMFGLSYDDLKQRHKERRMRRIITASLSAAAVCLAFGAVSTTMALRIHAQKEQIAGQNAEIIEQNSQITAQNAEIKAQAEDIQAKAKEIQAKNDSLALNQAITLAQESERKLDAGDRAGAVESAKSALTEWDGVAMPYTAEAQYALTESLYVYSVADKQLPMYQLQTEGTIEDIRTSPERKYFLCSDSTDTLYLFDGEEGSLIESFSLKMGYDGEDSYSFIGEDYLVYVDEEQGVTTYNISTKTKSSDILPKDSVSFLLNKGGNILWYVAGKFLYGMDTGTLETVYTYTPDESVYNLRLRTSDASGRYLAYTVFDTENSYLRLLDFAAAEPRENTFNFGEGSYSEGTFRDDSFYCITNESDQAYVDITMSVHCFDMNRLTKKWTYTQEDCYGGHLCPGVFEESETLAVGTSTEAILLNKDNGSYYDRFALGSSVISIYTSTASDLFFVFTRDGQLHSIFPATHTDYRNDMYICRSDNVHFTITCSDGFAAVPYSSNAATVYGFCNEDNLKDYSGEVSSSYDSVISYSEAEEFGREHGMPSPARIDRIAPGEGSIYYVHYRDAKELVIDASTDTILGSFTAEDTVYSCFGKDKQGNTYIGGGGSGYILNEKYELIGRVSSMVGLLPETNEVIVQGTGRVYYTLPIRSVEELLAYEP